MKAFTIPVGSDKYPHEFYIGEPSALRHPLYYQDLWWRQEHELVLPDEVMESFEHIYAIAYENNVMFEELAVFSLDHASTPSLKRDGNVLHADFARNAALNDAAPMQPLLSSDPALPDVLFFDAFRLEGQYLRAFCQALGQDIIPPDAPGMQDGALAAPLLSVIFFALATQGDCPRGEWKTRMDDYLSEHASYNLAVTADTIGYRLRIVDLGVLEFFFCCSIPVQDDICALIARSFTQWAGRPVSPRLLGAFTEAGLEKKDAEALKKVVKGLFA